MRKQTGSALSPWVTFRPDVAGAPSSRGEELADEDLISALAGRAAWAMELLYQRYSHLLYSLAYRIVGDLRAAEDLVQEVFLAVWQHAPSYAPQSGSVSTWLTAILRHRAFDHLRKMRRHHAAQEIPWEASSQDASTAAPDLWDEAWRSMQGALVRECLLRLQPEQRAVLELAYFEGRTHSEIASSCQLPLGTVKARMRLALRHLKGELEKRGMSSP